MAAARFVSSFFPAKVALPDSRQDEELPLHALDDDDEPRYVEPTPKVARRSSRLLRYSLLSVIAIILYNALSYLFSEPAKWERPWADRIFGPRPSLVSPIVRAAGKRWRGWEADGGDFIAFKAIPYAVPPVGELRFRQAVGVSVVERSTEKEWEELEIIDATRDEDGCPRLNPLDPTGETFAGNEDCLTVNIYTPRKRLDNVKLPVMVWIHGGGFYAGKGAEEQYDPRELMQRSQSMNQPLVFVSMNYRLGTLGFTSSPPKPGPPPLPPHIPIQAPDDLDLNVGFKDQLEALRFVYREIENFGGDPEKIVLVGHSAGAISVGLHQLYSPPHLFRGAFMLSGAPTSFPIPFPHDASARNLHPLPNPSGCPWPEQVPGGPPSNTKLLACLRSLPLEQLMQASKGFLELAPRNAYFPWYPVYEGNYNGSWLNVRPSDAIVRGTFSKVPVILGSVVDEGTRFTEPGTSSQEDIINILRGMFTFTYGSIETILTPIWEYYPDDPAVGSPYHTSTEQFGLESSYKRAASIIGDFLFQAPRRHFLRETPKDFGEPSWSYLYDEKRTGAEERVGVGHSADLKLWFDHPPPEDAQLKQLSRHMSSYLINFVANLDPNGPGLHYWPQYGTDRRILRLARHNVTVRHDDDRLEAMRFINENNPIFAR